MRTIVVLVLCLLTTFARSQTLPDGRPPPDQRDFTSPVINNLITDYQARMKDPNLGILFGNCLPNTLDTTVQNFTANSSYYGGGPDTFVITGDITAMWLRDSSGQVYPYVDYVTQDPELQTLILGVIGRQIRSINIDQYANAFNYQPTPNGPHMNDIVTPPMTDALYESKYELDSLAWVLRLMSHYWEVTEDDSFCNSNWTKAMETVLATIEYQQKPLTEMETTDELYYSFQRQTYSQIDTTMQSLGQPAAYCGLSRSPFRPSDDAQILPYPVLPFPFLYFNFE